MSAGLKEQKGRLQTLINELSSITDEQLELFTNLQWSDWDLSMDSIEFTIQELKDYGD